jgi:hypothetical protein
MNVQHIPARLTVLGFNLSLLIFVTASLITVANAGKPDVEFAWHYLESVVAIGLGFLYSLFGIVVFLRAQTSNNSSSWFTSGQLLLYFGLSQFLASGMNNLLFVITRALSDHPAGEAYVITWTLVLVAQSLWLWLLVGAPLVDLQQHARTAESAGERANSQRGAPGGAKVLWLVYAVLITITFLVDGSTYYLRREHHGIWEFLGRVIAQIGQPFLWLK